MDFRILDRRPDKQCGLSARAARVGGSRSQRHRASPDNLWLPGSWIWNQNRYAWRPGYWAAAQADWDWVPAHYVWRRAATFLSTATGITRSAAAACSSPVYFSGTAYTQPGFSYSPATAIDLGVLTSCLFLRPQYEHYYFGDYYAANYQTAGFYPSYSYNSGRMGYDPIFAHERWQHRQDGQWEQRVAADFQDRRARGCPAVADLGSPGALSGGKAPRTGRALRAIHEEPERFATIPTGRPGGTAKAGGARTRRAAIR